MKIIPSRISSLETNKARYILELRDVILGLQTHNFH